MSSFRGNIAAARRVVLDRAGVSCSFPGCHEKVSDSAGIPIVEVCHIEAVSPGGPRYNAKYDKSGRDGIDKYRGVPENLIVLCPNHHRLVDQDPFTYTVEFLRSAKERREAEVVRALQPPQDFSKLRGKIVSFVDGLELWKANQDNSDEEFWQKLFVEHPKLLAQAIPNCIFQIGDKCYLGGKDYSNRGGKVVDFLYKTQSTQNVVVVEIKTPVTRLIGKKYRSGVFSASDGLSGSVVQVLSYKNTLLMNYHAVFSATTNGEIGAFEPTCIVLIGNAEKELLLSNQRASFDLFRANSRVTIITFDELFAKIEALVELVRGDVT